MPYPRLGRLRLYQMQSRNSGFAQKLNCCRLPRRGMSQEQPVGSNVMEEKVPLFTQPREAEGPVKTASLR